MLGYGTRMIDRERQGYLLGARRVNLSLWFHESQKQRTENTGAFQRAGCEI